MAARTISFDELLEAAQRLPVEDQEQLVDMIRRRLAQRNRRRIAADVRKTRAEHQAGRCKPTSVDDLMREIES